MFDARSPKYPALYDLESGVRFRHGRAEVTAEQARALAKRRFVDGILIDGVPAKKWAAGTPAESSEPARGVEGEQTEPAEDTADVARRRRTKE